MSYNSKALVIVPGGRASWYCMLERQGRPRCSHLESRIDIRSLLSSGIYCTTGHAKGDADLEFDNLSKEFSMSIKNVRK